MPSNPPRVYWDSCVFIDRIQRTPGRIDLLEELTNLAEKGGLLIVTSALTIAEVLRGPDPTAPHEEQATLIVQYFDNEYIELRLLDRPLAVEAARLRRAHNLKTPDAVHIATALIGRVPEFHTYDTKDLLKRNGVCGTPPLRIVEPRHPESHPLFDMGKGTEQAGAPDTGAEPKVTRNSPEQSGPSSLSP